MKKFSTPPKLYMFNIKSEQIDFSLNNESPESWLSPVIPYEKFVENGHLSFRARNGRWVWSVNDYDLPMKDITREQPFIRLWKMTVHCVERPVGFGIITTVVSNFHGNVASFGAPGHSPDSHEIFPSLGTEGCMVDSFHDAVTARLNHSFQPMLTVSFDSMDVVYEIALEGMYLEDECLDQCDENSFEQDEFSSTESMDIIEDDEDPDFFH